MNNIKRKKIKISFYDRKTIFHEIEYYIKPEYFVKTCIEDAIKEINKESEFFKENQDNFLLFCSKKSGFPKLDLPSTKNTNFLTNFY